MHCQICFCLFGLVFAERKPWGWTPIPDTTRHIHHGGINGQWPNQTQDVNYHWVRTHVYMESWISRRSANATCQPFCFHLCIQNSICNCAPLCVPYPISYLHRCPPALDSMNGQAPMFILHLHLNANWKISKYFSRTYPFHWFSVTTIATQPLSAGFSLAGLQGTETLTCMSPTPSTTTLSC